MDITKARLLLSALATFRPTAPGSLKEQVMGLEGFSVDLAGMNLAHDIRLSVTNFGTGGATVTIDADTQQVNFGAAAVGTAVRGVGVDYDQESIGNLVGFHLVLFRVTADAGGDQMIQLSAANGGSPYFVLPAKVGGLGFFVLPGGPGIPGLGTWTIKGPAGLQAAPWVIEILSFAIAN